MENQGHIEDTHTMTWKTNEAPEAAPRLYISVTISDEDNNFSASQSIPKNTPELQIPSTMLAVAQAAAALYGTQTWANLQKLLPIGEAVRSTTPKIPRSS